MPVANKESKQQAWNTNTKRSWRGPLGAFIIAVVIFAIGFIITLYNSGGITLGQRAKFEEYLNNKYSQEFVVEKVRVSGAGLGVKGSWRAHAYPKSDPTIRFEIRRSQTTGKIDYETFLQTSWTKQGLEEVETFLNKEFPEREYYSLRISPGNTPDSPFYGLVRGKTLSLRDALAGYNDGILYELVVNDVVTTTSNEPSELPLGRAMKLVDFVKAQGAGIPSVNYGYRDASFTDKNSSGQQKYQYRIKLEREALQKVNSSSDLKQHLAAIEY